MAVNDVKMRFRNWSPRKHESLSPEEHMEKMFSVGKVGSKWIYFNPLITGISGILLWGFVIYASVASTDAAEDTAEAQKWVTDVWNWLYMFSQNVWIVVLLYLLIKYYNVRLGKDSDKPEFSDAAYFSMLFSCGVATGLWYFTAETMWHYESSTARWSDGQMWNDNTRAEHAMMVSFFHWGLHGWVPYVVVGALISLLTYRRGFPMSMRFTLYPLIGEMCYGVVGDLVEVLSILCTVFGVCTSLGLGAMQINKGLVRLDRGTYRGRDYIGCGPNSGFTCDGRTGLEDGRGAQIVIIAVITLLATASVVLGLKRGIAILSQVAFAMSLFILLSVLFLDETWYILNAITSTLGYYLWYLPKISFHTDAWEELGGPADHLGGAPDGRGGSQGWMNSWTMFYWGWWISWGPFVGTFLARISKGRRLGNFIIASLILPSLWSFCFMGVFGAAQTRITNLAVAAGLDGGVTGTDPALIYGSLANGAVDASVTRLSKLKAEDILFEHLASYGGQGWATFMTVITLICIVLYFITSSDSASFVVDMMAANGIEEPPVLQKVYWAITEGAAAAALLASASEEDPKAALTAIQSVPIILGLPFTFLIFWMCQSLLIVCKEESGEMEVDRKQFAVFLFNIEPMSFVACLAPFVPIYYVAQKAEMCMSSAVIVFAAWASMVTLFCLTAADRSFLPMAAAMYFLMAFSVTNVRVSLRVDRGISGGLISDACACCFALPWTVGQMYAEVFEAQ